MKNKYLKHFYSFCLLFLLSLKCFAQSYLIKGNVSTYTEPVRYASVTFVNENDSTRQYSTITDTLGNYQLSIITKVEENKPTYPSSFELAQNYPNPFSTETAITYKLNEHQNVYITIYNILGQEVKRFKIGVQGIGLHSITWNGTNNLGNKVSSGIYFYQMQSDRDVRTKKMIFHSEKSLYGTPNKYLTFAVQPKMLEKETRRYIEEGFYNIYITNTDTTEPKIIKKVLSELNIQSDTTLNFSVDKVKDEILYIKDTGDPLNCTIYVMDIDGTYHKKITDSVYAYGISRWSPDGKWIAYEGAYGYWENYEIFIVKADGTEKHIITKTEPFPEGGRHPVWSPDGKKIAFTKCINCELGGLNDEIFVIDIDTTGGVKETRLTNNLVYDKVIDWSPDGSKILFLSKYSLNSTYDFYADWYIMNPDGTGKERIFVNDSSFYASDMRYSPDGNIIAVSTLDGTYIMDKEGANFRRISGASGDSFSQISWSPDGKYLLSGGVFIINTDGSGYKYLLISSDPNNYSSPDWRPKME